jgi:protein-L-isoaspartate O-methyltransferase
MFRTLCTAVSFCLAGLAISALTCRGEEEAKKPDCVFVGTPNDVVAKMIEMASITKDDKVCDPGCGDARMVVAAARAHGCQGIGYEIDPDRIAEAKALIKKRKVENLVRIESKDIFTVDYRENTVILMYLLPNMILKLVPQFEQLKPGSRIVAHDYPIGGVEPTKEIEVKSNEDNVSHTLYLYVTPLKKTTN